MTEMVVKLSKSENTTARWLQKSADPNHARVVMNGVHVDDNLLVATDGIMLFAAQVEGEWSGWNGHDGQTFAGKIPATASLVELQIIAEGEKYSGEKYPDYKKLISNFTEGKEPIAVMCIDAERLVQAASGMARDKDSRILLRFYGHDKPIELLGRTKGYPHYGLYGIVMPMHIWDKDDIEAGLVPNWTPIGTATWPANSEGPVGRLKTENDNE